MAFLRAYAEAAEQLAEQSLYPLATMDCYDWTDVCARENITVYPTTRVYSKGQRITDYRGLLGSQVVVSYARL